MYKIGEFSKLAKTTVKTLRYYEKEGLTSPAFVDESSYRYYSSEQLIDMAKIVSLRQLGFSIERIKSILAGADINEMLSARKEELETQLSLYRSQLSAINYLLEVQEMNYEVVIKSLPECVVYYKEGVIRDFREASEFILSSAQECLKDNPGLRCVEPDYSFMNYLDQEHKETNIRIRYCQAVQTEGKPNATIGFKKFSPVNAACIYHRGQYDTLGEAYGFIMKYVEENGYEVCDLPRERYIDGIWNKENPEDWLTEIQVPIK